MNTTQYYEKTLKILLDDYACGLVTATGLIVEYIRIKFAPGEEIILEPKQVIAELGISKSQFYRGITKIKKFQKLTVVSRSYMKFDLEARGGES